MTDPISDFLTRIRNANSSRHEFVEMPGSKLKTELARLLKDEGYIEDYSVESARVGSTLKIKLKYTEEQLPVITDLKRVSKPGRRVFVGNEKVPKVLGGMGTAIISTSQGVVSGHHAKHRGIGGEVIAYVW